MAASIRTEYGPGGESLHLVPFPPASLPTVTKRDLEQAWEAARNAALAANSQRGQAPVHAFRSPSRMPHLWIWC